MHRDPAQLTLKIDGAWPANTPPAPSPYRFCRVLVMPGTSPVEWSVYVGGSTASVATITATAEYTMPVVSYNDAMQHTFTSNQPFTLCFSRDYKRELAALCVWAVESVGITRAMNRLFGG